MTLPVTREMKTVREFKRSNFRGKYPTVETAPSVDVEMLHGTDTDPFYVTLPVAVVGEVSRNGLRYDEELVGIMEAWMSSRTGIMGHTPDYEADTAFPKPEIYWVGATREGAALWAKGYVPPGETREAIRRLKATGADIATSIYGRGFAVMHEDYSYNLENFEFLRLDLAPTEQAALQLGGPVTITSEMSKSTTEEPVDKNQVLASLTAEDADKLPKTVIESIVSKHVPTDAGRVQELETLTAAQARTIAEMERKINEFQRVAFDASLSSFIEEKVTWKATTDEAVNALKTFRETVRQAVEAKVAGSTDIEKAKRTFGELWERQFRVLAETMVNALSGPSAVVAPTPKKDWRDEIVARASANASKILPK